MSTTTKKRNPSAEAARQIRERNRPAKAADDDQAITTESPAGPPPAPGTYELVPIAQVVVDAGFNNRKELGDLDELAASIRSVGLLQPLTVWKNGGPDVHVVAGHRRLAAAKLAGLAEIPVIVQDLDDLGRLSALLVENLMRQDIDPLEEADGYRRLTELGLSQRDIAAKVGRSQAHVSKRMALLQLPAAAVPHLASGLISLADAVELAGEKDADVSALVVGQIKEAAKRGWGISVVQQLKQGRREIETHRKIAAATAELEAAKVSILKTEPGYGNRSVMRLGTGYGCLPMSPAVHSKHGCHAAWVSPYGGEVIYACTKPENHAKEVDKKVAAAIRARQSNRGYSASGSDDAKKRASETRERNKQLRAIAPGRAEKVKDLLDGKPRKDQVLDFVLLQLLQRTLDKSGGANRLAASWLGVPDGNEGLPSWSGYLAAEASGFHDRLLKVAYAVSLALGEEPIGELPKRGYFDQELQVMSQRFFAHLQASGYSAQKIELDQLKGERYYHKAIEGKVGSGAKAQPIRGEQTTIEDALASAPAVIVGEAAPIKIRGREYQREGAVVAADGAVWYRGEDGHYATLKNAIAADSLEVLEKEEGPLTPLEERA